MTINVGIRYDYQTDYANPANVAASEMFGKNTFAGTYNDGGLFAGRYNGTYRGCRSTSCRHCPSRVRRRAWRGRTSPRVPA